MRPTVEERLSLTVSNQRGEGGGGRKALSTEKERSLIERKSHATHNHTHTTVVNSLHILFITRNNKKCTSSKSLLL